MGKEIKEIREIYDMSVNLYYQVADDNMRRRGHPGVMGPAGVIEPDTNKPWDVNIGMIEGAIETLKQIANKLK